MDDLIQKHASCVQETSWETSFSDVISIALVHSERKQRGIIHLHMINGGEQKNLGKRHKKQFLQLFLLESFDTFIQRLDLCSRDAYRGQWGLEP